MLISRIVSWLKYQLKIFFVTGVFWAIPAVFITKGLAHFFNVKVEGEWGVNLLILCIWLVAPIVDSLHKVALEHFCPKSPPKK